MISRASAIVLTAVLCASACGHSVPVAAPARVDEAATWAALRASLFRWRVVETVSPCFSAEAANGHRCTEQASALLGLDWAKREREQTEDESLLIHRGVPSELATPERVAAITAAIGDGVRAARQLAHDVAAGAATPTRIASALLLQHDLWLFHDRLADFARMAPELAPRFAELRAELVPIVRALALPAAAIRALPPNLPAIARANPDIAGGLDTEAGWVETTELPTDGPDDDRSGATSHARVTGYTTVFRVLVAPPDTADLVRALDASPADVTLAPATRLAIVETPLVIDDRGDIVPLPITTLVETAHTLDAGVTPATLADLPFDVIEVDHRSAALRRLPADAMFPFGGAVSGLPVVLPMRNACLSCHDPRASTLKNAQLTAPNRMALAPDREDQLRRVVAAKRASADFVELQRAFAAGDR